MKEIKKRSSTKGGEMILTATRGGQVWLCGGGGGGSTWRTA